MQELSYYDLKKIRVDKTPRPLQTQLFEFSKDAVLSNKKNIICDAPTGVGKSTFGVMFMDWYKKNYDISATFDILTDSKILQEQYTNEFDFMNSLWGKGSYQCEKYNCSCDTGQEWARIQGTKCEGCPYSGAKYKFENGDVALTNFHLFLTYKLYMPMAWKRTSRVLIIDESDRFESIFCDFVTCKISKAILKRNGFTDDETDKAMRLFGDDCENMSLSTFVEIVDTSFLPMVKTVLNRLSREAQETKNINLINNIQSLNNNLIKWESLSKEVNLLPDNWILESEYVYKNDVKTGKVKEKYIEFTAQPVWAYPYLEEKIWSLYDHIVFMSGTILSKDIFSQMNGLDINMTDYISVDSPFSIENRPIYFFNNIGKMTYATKQIVFEKQKVVLKKILKRHKNEMGIIHTGNYELQKWCVDQLNEDRLLAHDSTNRSEILQQHFNTDEPTVLVSPSLMVGIDLKDDFSRHQTILKMPYPNLKSKKVKQRMETNKEYYGLTVVRDVVQSYGRSIRGMDDHANTYVLDGCFADLLKWNRKYFPKWMLDAIQYVD